MHEWLIVYFDKGGTESFCQVKVKGDDILQACHAANIWDYKLISKIEMTTPYTIDLIGQQG